MISSVTLSGLTGFGMILAALFSITDLKDLLAHSTGTPFITIFTKVLGSPGSAVGLLRIALLHIQQE